MTDELWPALPYDAWKDTYATLHMWTQVVGEGRAGAGAASSTVLGDCVAGDPRGLSTPSLPQTRSFTMEFDFIDHQLVVHTGRASGGRSPSQSRSVADFYRDVMATLSEMALPVKIWPMPVEIPSPIRFEQDTEHHSYDPEREPLLAHPGAGGARLHGCALRVRRQVQSGAFLLGRLRPGGHALFRQAGAAA